MKAKIIIVVIVVIAAVYLLSRGSSSTKLANQNTPNPSPSQTQGIQNDSGLTSTSKDLDNIDVNSVDSELDQNQTDASTF